MELLLDDVKDLNIIQNIWNEKRDGECQGFGKDSVKI